MISFDEKESSSEISGLQPELAEASINLMVLETFRPPAAGLYFKVKIFDDVMKDINTALEIAALGSSWKVLGSHSHPAHDEQVDELLVVVLIQAERDLQRRRIVVHEIEVLFRHYLP